MENPARRSMPPPPPPEVLRATRPIKSEMKRADEPKPSPNTMRADSGVMEVGQRPEGGAKDESIEDVFGDLNDEKDEEERSGVHLRTVEAPVPRRGTDPAAQRVSDRFDRDVEEVLSRLDIPPGTVPIKARVGEVQKARSGAEKSGEPTRVLSGIELATIVGDAERMAARSEVQEVPIGEISDADLVELDDAEELDDAYLAKNMVEVKVPTPNIDLEALKTGRVTVPSAYQEDGRKKVQKLSPEEAKEIMRDLNSIDEPARYKKELDDDLDALRKKISQST